MGILALLFPTRVFQVCRISWAIWKPSTIKTSKHLDDRFNDLRAFWAWSFRLGLMDLVALIFASFTLLSPLRLPYLVHYSLLVVRKYRIPVEIPITVEGLVEPRSDLLWQVWCWSGIRALCDVAVAPAGFLVLVTGVRVPATWRELNAARLEQPLPLPFDPTANEISQDSLKWSLKPHGVTLKQAAMVLLDAIFAPLVLVLMLTFYRGRRLRELIQEDFGPKARWETLRQSSLLGLDLLALPGTLITLFTCYRSGEMRWILRRKKWVESDAFPNPLHLSVAKHVLLLLLDLLIFPFFLLIVFTRYRSGRVWDALAFAHAWQLPLQSPSTGATEGPSGVIPAETTEGSVQPQTAAANSASGSLGSHATSTAPGESADGGSCAQEGGADSVLAFEGEGREPPPKDMHASPRLSAGGEDGWSDTEQADDEPPDDWEVVAEGIDGQDVVTPDAIDVNVLDELMDNSERAAPLEQAPENEPTPKPVPLRRLLSVHVSVMLTAGHMLHDLLLLVVVLQLYWDGAPSVLIDDHEVGS
ncbi:hypothetical protein CYMTET_17707 [Cymbomonas tetramitiformis]|uniref:Uncharacterized protein n=1 Tax=Cymbomonas tetramitiformis TaxID=36881 RepID=A0AAE0GA15_9CHLO|nr:hypothetical protein CYMTET_17707 [Cymbomonas tetramitiformis]